ncbi:hypothetical protein G6N74_29535 [Mesorhizobium sp. CGMCC 1.15528]|uniref:Uncharacterized protein n=1 Tax=Mesorhizobium zhangyense TaxID=1776730 RepID=A0A7C9RCN3_9HYPH|nr:hypothetical protein [Mesorhizobium zhangyense]NGN45199.1 hypothetical protein [Mesorhizobium zhangyense]
MGLDSMFGGGHILIVMLGLLGALLLIVSVFINNQVAHYTQRDERHKEKQLEYYRNTFSQLGVILLGIAVSLFIFFFQQSYLERQRHETQMQELLAKLSVRLSRAAPLLEFVAEIDPVLDDGGAYIDPADGGSNRAVSATGPDFARQVQAIELLQREIDLEDFGAMQFSGDFQSSPLVNQIDPSLWFGMVKDEADLAYAAEQLRQDYGDLRAVLGARKPGEGVSDPDVAGSLKREVLDVLWDYAWLRDRSRRLVGRACWFLSEGPKFLSLKPIGAVEVRYDSHREWLVEARKAYEPVSAGGENCYAMLRVAEQS